MARCINCGEEVDEEGNCSSPDGCGAEHPDTFEFDDADPPHVPAAPSKEIPENVPPPAPPEEGVSPAG